MYETRVRSVPRARHTHTGHALLLPRRIEKPSFTEETTHRLQQVFEYIRNNPEVATERLEQVDRAIRRFNNYHDRGSFPHNTVNAINLSRMLKVMPSIE